MPESRERWIERKIYSFIKNYGKYNRVYMINIHLYARRFGITKQETGYAIQRLKEKRAIFFAGKRRGWIAR